MICCLFYLIHKSINLRTVPSVDWHVLVTVSPILHSSKDFAISENDIFCTDIQLSWCCLIPKAWYIGNDGWVAYGIDTDCCLSSMPRFESSLILAYKKDTSDSRLPLWTCNLRCCHWLLAVSHHCPDLSPALAMWEGYQILSTTYNWPVTISCNMAEKVMKIKILN